jgi:hypothetical protein
MSPNIAIRIVLRSMSPNVITVYDFVFGALFCAEKIYQQKLSRRRSLAYLKSFDAAFQGNLAHHESIDVTPQMAFEDGFEKFVHFAFLALNFKFNPAIDQVLHASNHIVPGSD